MGTLRDSFFHRILKLCYYQGVVDILEDLLYTESHEWIQVIDNIAYIGLSEHAQDALGEIVFVEIPEVGKKVSKGDEILSIESAKVAQGLIAPVSGIVMDINEDLREEPERINTSAFDTFIYSIQISNMKELDSYMNAEQYRKYIDGLDSS